MQAPDFAPFLGDPRIVAEGNYVKGTLLSARAQAIRQNYGDRFVADLGRQLSPQAARYLLVPQLPSSWNELGPMTEIDLALLNGVFGGKLEKMRHFGADVARHDLTTVYKTMSGSPSLLFKRIGLVFKTYFKFGDMSTANVSEVSGTVTLSGGGIPYYVCSQGILGWLEGGLQLSGSRRIAVDHTACRHHGAPRCVWSVSWG
ncbi:hypothetical protein SOCE26_043440 [Sorangium cellulosum]|uniref:4-vinyl reductase 4VR domain-containing protein n=1 Tax=Sorangium cellulosum TaxID=56 RepID=A0A2L0EUD0_SORCE|nr:hypothetical protein [Sorangium cellulosum]AUX42906.1 hypothetical protein SOCE26_043440 [Sorangium cellulosum]